MPYTNDDYVRDVYIREHGEGMAKEDARTRSMLYEHGHLDKIEGFERANGRGEELGTPLSEEEYNKLFDAVTIKYADLKNKAMFSDEPGIQERLQREMNEELEILKKRRQLMVNSQNKSSGGCYVATCVYGSYDCPEVWVLRRYRDYDLSNSALGRLFIRAYYMCSPTVVRLFGNQKWFKDMWKPILNRMVYNLSQKGYSDKPYNDL